MLALLSLPLSLSGTVAVPDNYGHGNMFGHCAVMDCLAHARRRSEACIKSGVPRQARSVASVGSAADVLCRPTRRPRLWAEAGPWQRLG